MTTCKNQQPLNFGNSDQATFKVCTFLVNVVSNMYEQWEAAGSPEFGYFNWQPVNACPVTLISKWQTTNLVILSGAHSLTQTKKVHIQFRNRLHPSSDPTSIAAFTSYSEAARAQPTLLQTTRQIWCLITHRPTILSRTFKLNRDGTQCIPDFTKRCVSYSSRSEVKTLSSLAIVSARHSLRSPFRTPSSLIIYMCAITILPVRGLGTNRSPRTTKA